VGTLGQGSTFERAVNGALHVLASVMTGAAFGYVLGLVGSVVPHQLRVPLAVAFALGYAGMELKLVTLPLPETKRQVPANWRYRFPRPVTAAMYGALLGPGIATHVATATYMSLLTVVLFTLTPLKASLAFGLFGLVKAAAAAIAAWPARKDPQRAMFWGYRTGQLWRLAGVLLTTLTAGALVSSAIL